MVIDRCALLLKTNIHETNYFTTINSANNPSFLCETSSPNHSPKP